MGQATEASVKVRIPAHLLTRTRNRRTLTASGRTVREVIDDLETDNPGLKFNICHETGELRPFVNVFVEEENIRFMDGLETRVEPGTTVHIFHSVAGGSERTLVHYDDDRDRPAWADAYDFG